MRHLLNTRQIRKRIKHHRPILKDQSPLKLGPFLLDLQQRLAPAAADINKYCPILQVGCISELLAEWIHAQNGQRGVLRRHGNVELLNSAGVLRYNLEEAGTGFAVSPGEYILGHAGSVAPADVAEILW